MNMYNNLPQSAPAYYYMPQNYQRAAAQAPQAEQGAASAPYYTAPLMQYNYIKGRPVVSIDEARASQIDLDGSLYVFPDLGNKRIYTKQINMDGTATFNVFELAVQPPTEPQVNAEYITRAQLDEILEQFKNTLIQNSAAKASAAKNNFNL